MGLREGVSDEGRPGASLCRRSLVRGFARETAALLVPVGIACWWPQGGVPAEPLVCDPSPRPTPPAPPQHEHSGEKAPKQGPSPMARGWAGFRAGDWCCGQLRRPASGLWGVLSCTEGLGYRRPPSWTPFAAPPALAPPLMCASRACRRSAALLRPRGKQGGDGLCGRSGSHRAPGKGKEARPSVCERTRPARLHCLVTSDPLFPLPSSGHPHHG